MDFKGLSLSSLFVFIIIFRNLAEVDKMSLIQLSQREIDKKRLVISTSSRYKFKLSLRLRPTPFKQRTVGKTFLLRECLLGELPLYHY